MPYNWKLVNKEGANTMLFAGDTLTALAITWRIGNDTEGALRERVPQRSVPSSGRYTNGIANFELAIPVYTFT